MVLEPKQRLGPYEILTAVGAGGMGEVYRARDMRLDRIVAVKILSDHIAGRAGLRERFDREARTVASLNHPHICTLFDIGSQDGIDYLVMEYLEGETLPEHLKKGPLPLSQTLQYAIEIADALDKAHRKGITHRDLKPSNIMLTKSGTKLLDFGLAKLRQEAAPAAPLSELPTERDSITAQGIIVGTLRYMAPEQIEARPVDARTDIFAFGVVVYEMATGKRAFDGKSQASVMAKILETDPPPISSLQPMTPPALDHLVKRCLAKDPDERWQSARDICEQLRWISDSGSQAGATASAPAVARRSLKKRFAWITAAVAILVAALAAGVLYVRRPPAEVRAVRFTVAPPEKQIFPVGPTPNFLSVSPDGSKLAFVAQDSTGHSMLWIRDLGSQAAQPLLGTDGASAPFWSPDSRFIAFTASNALKKVAVGGGPAQTITALPGSGMGTWNRDGVILFVPAPLSAVLRVSAEGGLATPAASFDPSRQLGHVWPQFLPDGRHFLYLVVGTNPENTGIYVGSLDSKETKLVLKANSSPLYSPPGYLLFLRAGVLLAQPFDADRLELKGDAIPVAESVQFNPTNGKAAVAVSQNGVLAYRSVPSAGQFKLVWVDRKGTEQTVSAPPHNYVMPRVSPDGQRVAAGIEEADSQIWVYDLNRDTLTRLTFEANANIDPIWTPDGKRIVFKGNQQRLVWQSADGSGPAEEMTKSELPPNDIPGSFSPDGQVLAFSTGTDVYTLSVKDGKPQPFVNTPSTETAPRFSPDGHFIAYASNESGRFEIYVRPYPGPGGKWQISTDGGTEPVWNPKGRELFYREGKKMMAVDVTTQPIFSAGKPRMLFEGPYAPTPRSFPDYDVSPDGQRFLMLKTNEQAQAPPQLSVVLNWTEELKQKVPTGK